jgi:hypothetical protein
MTHSARRGRETDGRAGPVGRVLASHLSARRLLESNDGPYDALRLEVAGRSAIIVEGSEGCFVLVSQTARHRPIPLTPLSLRTIGRAARRLFDRLGGGRTGSPAKRKSYFPLTVDIDVVARLRLPIDQWLDRGLLVPSVSAADAYILLPDGGRGDAGGQQIAVRTLREAD